MKEEIAQLETKIKNLTYIIILGFVIIGLLIIGLYFKGSSTTQASTNSTAEGSETYDVSKMNAVTGEQANELFDEEGTHILFIGRSTCSVCVTLVPELNEVIDDLDVTINYLTLNSTFRDDFGDLFDKLTVETTVNGNSGTFGELLEEYGYTPIVIIIKDGKMVDGFVGYRDSDTIETLFKKYL